MDIEQFRSHCMSVRGAEESLPFVGHNVLVFKVVGKMFAYIALEPADGVFRAAMKCHPDRSAELREQYEGIARGRFETLLWNDVVLESDVPDELIVELIRHSVDEVVKKMPKKLREEWYGL